MLNIEALRSTYRNMTQEVERMEEDLEERRKILSDLEDEYEALREASNAMRELIAIMERVPF